MKDKWILKFLTVVLGALIVLLLVKGLFSPAGFGFGVNFRTNYGGGNISMGNYVGYGFSVGVLLTYLIKFLFIVFVIGLVGGLVVAAKNYIFTPEDIENFKAPFRGNKSKNNKTICSICGKEIDEDWKVCPYCSATVEK